MEELGSKDDSRNTEEVEKGPRPKNRNLEKKLRKTIETTQPGDNVSLRVEMKDKKDTRHKLARIAEVTYPVLSEDSASKTVVVKLPDESVTNVSRRRVAIVPKSDNFGYKEQEKLPVSIRSIIIDYPVAEQPTWKTSTSHYRYPIKKKGRTSPVISKIIMSRRTKNRPI